MALGLVEETTRVYLRTTRYLTVVCKLLAIIRPHCLSAVVAARA